MSTATITKHISLPAAQHSALKVKSMTSMQVLMQSSHQQVLREHVTSATTNQRLSTMPPRRLHSRATSAGDDAERDAGRRSVDDDDQTRRRSTRASFVVTRRTTDNDTRRRQSTSVTAAAVARTTRQQQLHLDVAGIPLSVADKTNSDGKRVHFAAVNAVKAMRRSTDSPDWYIALNDSQYNVFKQLLRTLDSHTLWTMNIRTIVFLLNSLDSRLRFTERDVIDTLNVLYDNSRDEEVDFDEFLYQLALLDTERAESPREAAETSYTVAERLFYSAIADFTAMLTTETAHSYDSVIRALFKSMSVASTADSRSWVQQTYSDMKAFARCHWSPLAQPLPFASTYKQREILGCKRRRQKSIVVDDLSPLAMYALRKASLVPQSAARSARDLDEDAAHGRTAAAAAAADNTHQVLLTDDDIKGVLKVYAANGSVVARIPGAHLVPKLRHKLVHMSIYQPLTSSHRKRRRQTMYRLRRDLFRFELDDKSTRTREYFNDAQFISPRVDVVKVSIPRCTLTRAERLHNTPRNVHRSRKRIDKLRADYYRKLKKSHADLGWTLLRAFPVDRLDSSMQERFLDMFRSYIPLYAAEVLFPRN